jgi:hypothetical protein
MVFTMEAFGVELVHIFSAGRPGGGTSLAL